MIKNSLSISSKRDNIRIQIRKNHLEENFKQSRTLSSTNSLDLNSDNLISQLQNDLETKQSNLEKAITILQNIQNNIQNASNTQNELIFLVLRFLEQFELRNQIVAEYLVDVQFEYLLMQLFENHEQVRIHIIVTLTNYLLTEKLTVQYYCVEQLLLLKILDYFQSTDSLISSQIIYCVSQMPQCFLKMHSLDIQMELVRKFKIKKDCNIEDYYLLLKKISDPISTEIFRNFENNQIIKETLQDYKNGVNAAVGVLINLSFLENEELESICGYDFFGATIISKRLDFEDIWILLNNVLLTTYSIRLLAYDYNIFFHIETAILQNLKFYKQEVLFEVNLNIIQVLLCLQTLLQSDDIEYKNVQNQIKQSKLEQAMQEVFQEKLICEDLILTTAQTLLLYYQYFQYTPNTNFEHHLSLIQHKHQHLEELYQFINI